ncbi:MAG: hypothetical protein ACTS4U_00040 [Candidatus Hodgkinia cicadicola]
MKIDFTLFAILEEMTFWQVNDFKSWNFWVFGLMKFLLDTDIVKV